MRTLRWVVVSAMVVGGASAVVAHEGHEEAVPENTSTEQVLTGEVVDVFCYLGHGEKGRGKDHISCAQHCIKNGLPVAIKVGDQLYLAAMADHKPANESLVEFAGQQVTVHGQVMEADGQHLIAISSVKKAE